jgi:hypothetical protein
MRVFEKHVKVEWLVERGKGGTTGCGDVRSLRSTHCARWRTAWRINKLIVFVIVQRHFQRNSACDRHQQNLQATVWNRSLINWQRLRQQATCGLTTRTRAGWCCACPSWSAASECERLGVPQSLRADVSLHAAGCDTVSLQDSSGAASKQWTAAGVVMKPVSTTTGPSTSTTPGSGPLRIHAEPWRCHSVPQKLLRCAVTKKRLSGPIFEEASGTCINCRVRALLSLWKQFMRTQHFSSRMIYTSV